MIMKGLYLRMVFIIMAFLFVIALSDIFFLESGQYIKLVVIAFFINDRFFPFEKIS